MKPEAELKSKIRKYLNTVEGLHAFHYSAYLGEAGIPDYIGVYKGLFIGIEVKTPKGKVTEKQEYKHKILKDCGGKVIVARSVEDVKDFIHELNCDLHRL